MPTDLLAPVRRHCYGSLVGLSLATLMLPRIGWWLLGPVWILAAILELDALRRREFGHALGLAGFWFLITMIL
ncbi:hypothetical protein [Lacticaseibacillus absianus]|uniref:hypothetical protein n=1 Tax=Lacticaseibacillus absianus TaxID=2729623 RepID=UPI0015CD1082|nr:hypothetical protein [Lacticaseibacillus absianus]